MKYMRGVNFNVDCKAYIQTHFEEEDQNLVEKQIQQQKNIVDDTEDQDLKQIDENSKEK